MVLTDVLAEICMSAGPNSVAPVSRPDTVMMADIAMCSMNGRAITISIGSQTPASTSDDEPRSPAHGEASLVPEASTETPGQEAAVDAFIARCCMRQRSSVARLSGDVGDVSARRPKLGDLTPPARTSSVRTTAIAEQIDLRRAHHPRCRPCPRRTASRRGCARAGPSPRRR